MMNSGQVFELLSFLLMVVLFIPVFYKFKVNTLFAFITAGILLGPHGLGIIKDTDITKSLGNLGLLFLMFSIGLDLSFHRFKAMRVYIFGFGLVQLFGTALFFGLVTFLIGRSLDEGIVVGFALAMSSTAIALRMLEARGKMKTPAGRASIGILLLQDLSVIPILLLLPRLAHHSGTSTMTKIAHSVGLAFLAIALIVVIGKILVKPLFRVVAATKSSEAFTSMIFLVFIATAWATHMAGLSVSLGAFLAGMLIAETDYGHEVKAETTTMSALLLGIFFLSVGMMIDVPYVIRHVPQIVILTLLIMISKTLLLYAMERKMGMDHQGSLISAVFLAQIGEFGFVIFNMASQQYQLMDPGVSSMLQVVIAFSMILNPFVGNALLKRYEEKAKMADAAKDVSEDKEEDDQLSGHVVIIGYGRIGQLAAQIFEKSKTPFCVIDTDVQRIELAHYNKYPAIFGNAANGTILEAVNVTEAKAVIVCLGNVETAVYVLQRIREVSKVAVFSRCNDEARWNDMMRLGATGLVSETQECAIRLANAAALSLETDEHDLKKAASDIRQEQTVNINLSDEELTSPKEKVPVA